MTKPRRPSPIHVGDLHARVVRGPDAQGRWYWRWARRGTDDKDGGALGWRTGDEASRELARLVGADGRVHGRPDMRTVRDLLETWMAAQLGRADLSPETVKQRHHCAKTLAARIGDVLLAKVNRAVLDAYRDRRLVEKAVARTTTRDGRKIEKTLERTIRPRTVRLEIEVLRTAWRWGLEIGGIPADRDVPTTKVLVKGWARNRTTPTRAHVERVLAELQGWHRLGFLLLAGTGCRRSEILNLRWDQVDTEGARLRVSGKTGERVVPIAPDLVTALEHARESAAAAVLVFPASRHTRLAIDAAIERACRRAEVPAFAPGGLRRFAVKELYRSGVDPSIAGAVVGHSPAVALRHYNEISEEERAAAVAQARLGQFGTAGTVVPFPGAERKG